jgi:hypothetical protein
MLQKALISIIFLLALVFVSLKIFGNLRWEIGTRKLRAQLNASRASIQPQAVDFIELESLPAPVQRYFRKTLQNGRSMLARVYMQHQGTFNMGETADRWLPFTSNQQVVVQHPGFDWDGRISMFPGISFTVHDAYIAGEGILHDLDWYCSSAAIIKSPIRDRLLILLPTVHNVVARLGDGPILLSTDD